LADCCAAKEQMFRRLLGYVLVAWLLVLPTAQADAQNVLASGESLFHGEWNYRIQPHT
jgi:hypothetical protein